MAKKKSTPVQLAVRQIIKDFQDSCAKNYSVGTEEEFLKELIDQMHGELEGSKMRLEELAEENGDE